MGTKADLQDRALTKADGMDLARRVGASAYCECSALEVVRHVAQLSNCSAADIEGIVGEPSDSVRQVLLEACKVSAFPRRGVRGKSAMNCLIM